MTSNTWKEKRIQELNKLEELNNKDKCPKCHYDGGEPGHDKQLNLNNQHDLICSSCRYVWQEKRCLICNAKRKDCVC